MLLWVLGEPDRLPGATRGALADAGNAVFVSVVSLWEIVLKHRTGRLDADIGAIAGQLAPVSKIRLLGLLPRHLTELQRLPLHARHRDPFDHLLVAQAIAEDMSLVTRDENAALYAVRVMRA